MYTHAHARTHIHTVCVTDVTARHIRWLDVIVPLINGMYKCNVHTLLNKLCSIFFIHIYWLAGRQVSTYAHFIRFGHIVCLFFCLQASLCGCRLSLSPLFCVCIYIMEAADTVTSGIYQPVLTNRTEHLWTWVCHVFTPFYQLRLLTVIFFFFALASKRVYMQCMKFKEEKKNANSMAAAPAIHLSIFTNAITFIIISVIIMF